MTLKAPNLNQTHPQTSSPRPKQTHIGVLLINLGTPDAPTPKAIRKYLWQFLSDQRVIETPRLIWWPILLGIILPLRPRKLQHAYQQMWQLGEGESPLRTITESQKQALQAELSQTSPQQEALNETGPQSQEDKTPTFFIEAGMTYGNPSIQAALQRLTQHRLDKLIVLPLFPQYSATSSAASFDVLAQALRTQRNLPNLVFVKDYHDHPSYITALTQSIRQHWQIKGRQGKLLFSFHGIPQAYINKGDPYQSQCETTAQLVSKQLGLNPNEWFVSYQSRVGKAQWIKPYTDKTLSQWGTQGQQDVDVICPGFAVDCLETLEEIDLQNRALFENAGGTGFHYIPALNSTPPFIDALKDLILPLSR